MIGTLKAYAVAFIAALAAFAGIVLYGKGRKDAQADVRDDDYENAEDIRRRVSVDRAKRMRELDDAGWRD